MGENAVRMLIDLMNGEEVENFEVPTKFVMRSSFIHNSIDEYQDARRKEVLEIEQEYLEALYQRRNEV